MDEAGPERITAVIQARMGSTRLPGKVLMTAVGRTMLDLLVERLGRAKRVEQIIVATSEAPADRRLIAEADRLKVPVFVGSEHDVLSRYVGVVQKYDLAAVVRITGDCPLVDPAVVDFVIDRFVRAGVDYCGNAHPRSVPKGLDVEVVSRAALERTDREASDLASREHVTQFIYHHSERFKVLAAAPFDPVLARHRWTLDTAADYAFLKAIFEALYPRNPRFGMNDVIALLEEHPNLELELRRSLNQA